MHGVVVGSIADSAGEVRGDDSLVPTVEYKMNLVAPADGQSLVALGQVIRSGHTLIALLNLTVHHHDRLLNPRAKGVDTYAASPAAWDTAHPGPPSPAVAYRLHQLQKP